MTKQRFLLLWRLSFIMAIVISLVFSSPLRGNTQSINLPMEYQFELDEVDNDDPSYLEQYQRLQESLERFHLIGLYQVSEGEESSFSLSIPAIYQQRKSLRVWYLSLDNDGEVKKYPDAKILETEVTITPQQSGYYALLDLKAVSISIYKEPDKMFFSANEIRDFTGMIIEVHLEDGTSYLTEEFTIGDSELTDIFHDEVEIIYENCKTTLVIGVGPIACGCFTGVYQQVLSVMVAGVLMLILIRRK